MWQVGVLAALALSALFLLRGRRLYERLPAVRRFRAASGALTAVRLKSAEPTFLSAFCKQELRVVATNQSIAGVDRHLQLKALGDIIGILHYRDHAIRHTLTELQIYCFLLIIFGLGAILFFLGDKLQHSANPLFLVAEYWTWSGNTPFKVLAAFELCALVFFAAKFLIELLSLSSLVDGH